VTNDAHEPHMASEGHRKALRMRQALNQAPFIVVVLLLLVAAVLVEIDRWRRGGAVIGFAVIVAAVLRAALPTNRAGLLAVRGRVFDVVVLALVGAAILWVSWTINPLGTGRN
jgi:cation transport ATPase